MEFEDLVKNHLNGTVEGESKAEVQDDSSLQTEGNELKVVEAKEVDKPIDSTDNVIPPVKKEVIKEEVKAVDNSDSDVIDFSSDFKKETEVKKEDVAESFNMNDEFKKAYPNYNSLDEVMAELEELKSNKPSISNEDLSKVASLLKDGEIDWNKIKEMADIRTMDVDSISERDTYIKGLRIEGYTNEEINDELKIFDSVFNFDEEDAMDNELLSNKREKSKFRREIKRYKDSLTSLKGKEEYNLPKVDLSSLSGKEKAHQEEVMKQQELIAENWKKQVESKVGDFKEVVFDLDKDKKYNFKVTDEDLSFIQDSISDTSNLYKPYIDEEKKSFDFKAMRQDLFMARNWKTVVSALIKQNANNKAEEVLKDLNNPNFEGSSKSGGTQSSNPYDAVAKAMMEGR